MSSRFGYYTEQNPVRRAAILRRQADQVLMAVVTVKNALSVLERDAELLKEFSDYEEVQKIL